MTTIRQEDLIESVADALQFISYYHPLDYIWRWVPTNYCRSPSTIQTWLDDNAKFNPQAQLTFAIIDIDTHTVVGTTRLFRLDSHNLSAEVGHTFIGVPWQRSYVNTHAKHLILTYAFEQLNLVRVTICTNEKNDKS
ncbi:MAG: GNAT family protein, partial [Pseudomonadota bacterium]